MAVILDYRLWPGELKGVQDDSDLDIQEYSGVVFWQGILLADQTLQVSEVDLSLGRAYLVQFTVYATEAVMKLDHGQAESYYCDSSSDYELTFRRSKDEILISCIRNAEKFNVHCAQSVLSLAFRAYARRVYTDLCEHLPALEKNEWFATAFDRIFRDELPAPPI